LCDNNRAVVLGTISLGAIVRALSFVDLTEVYNGCVAEEVFRSIKDICFLTSFLLIVLFWVELQNSVQRRGNIDEYRPWLYGILSVYSLLRVLNSIFSIAFFRDSDPQWPATATNALSYVIYLGVMVTAAVYGAQLIWKISSIRGGGDAAEKR